MNQMSFIADLQKCLQILISNYEPVFIIFCGYSNWHLLIRQNFGLELPAGVPALELQMLCIEKCFKQKFIFCGLYHTFIRSRKGEIMSCWHNSEGELGHGNTIPALSFKKIEYLPQGISRVFCGDYHTIIQLSNGKVMSCGSSDTKRYKFEEISTVLQNTYLKMYAVINVHLFFWVVEELSCGCGYSGTLGTVIHCRDCYLKKYRKYLAI